MRVVAGRFRGRGLEAPPGRTTRPITDRVKENLFNILGHRFAEPGALPPLDVLDLFSGPGSLGIEALSRGARSCVFVERDRAALQALRTNLTTLGLQSETRIVAENAWTMRPPRRAHAVADPATAAPQSAGFGLVFLDPPYREATDVLRIADVLERLTPTLVPEGVIVFRHEVHTPRPPEQTLRGLRYVDERVYGHMRLVFIGPASGAKSPNVEM